MTPNEQLVADLSYLEDEGMAIELVRELHHQPEKRDSYEQLREYFSRHDTMTSVTNQAFAARIKLVASLQRGSFAGLAGVALQRFPKST